MRVLPVLILAAGGVLAWIALRTDDPTYVAPRRDEMPRVVPHAVSGVVPAGFALRTFAVEGMCCAGCPGKLYAKLEALEGVREAAVDPVRECAEVVVPASEDPALVAQALTFDQYTAHLAE